MTVPLPPALHAQLVAELDARGAGQLTAVRGVPGGCISETARIDTSLGHSFFLKWSAGNAPQGMFAAEAHALGRLADARSLRVPAVIAIGEQAGHPWLLLEWLEPGDATRATWERLGAGLAALHRTTDARFGWSADNFIGTLHQPNAPAATWPEFWRERRLRPQLELALASGAFGSAEAKRFDALLAELDDILAVAGVDGPSLLHGDLWSGNLYVTAAHEPALIDPSSYFGHREVDLAMTRLFGGFDARFLDAYRNAWPVEPGFDRLRCPVYQLYYLLVHVNLFGGSYRASTLEALRAAGF